jgi:hypothetical protein
LGRLQLPLPTILARIPPTRSVGWSKAILAT